MVKFFADGIWIKNGREIMKENPSDPVKGRRNTIAAGILMEHHEGKTIDETPSELRLKFDSLVSHDITYVNIIQSARPSGLEEFPLPYVLTNCHNSLCAVGGTINADDHLFGRSAAKRYGGIFVPPHLAVIHSYAREAMAGCGKMILGSDSHTRYGSYGCMGVGEGGGELVKQLLSQRYEVSLPKIIAVYLTGKTRRGIGPQDIALAIIGALFKEGHAKNAVLEFIGDGIEDLSADFRAGIDVMTTETTCWSSIWETDDKIKQFYKIHQRENDYKKLFPGNEAYYDGLLHVDLSAIKPMIALPFHPSNVYEIDTLLANSKDIFRELEKDSKELLENPDINLNLMDKIDSKGRILVDQAIIAGCAGGSFDNLMAVNSILENCLPKNQDIGINFSIYPGSQPIMLELTKNGTLSSLIKNGAIIRSAFCGPCFGAGDVPSNQGLSLRHCTRNFPNREGSMPNNGQISSVCLMDARSIASSIINGGYLSSIESLDWEEKIQDYNYDSSPYKMVYNGYGRPDKNAEIVFGPNIADWPEMDPLGENLLLKIASFIEDPVTTTDELIPSGETSSFRSNPLKLAEFTLSRKDPLYAGLAKQVNDVSGLIKTRNYEGAKEILPEIIPVYKTIYEICGMEMNDIQLSSAIFAKKPGDGSAREQAASCQRVLGASANFAFEYATKRYRSNLINWGIIPFLIDAELPFIKGDYVFIPGLKKAILEDAQKIIAFSISPNKKPVEFTLPLPDFTPSEKELILEGGLINVNKAKRSS